MFATRSEDPLSQFPEVARTSYSVKNTKLFSLIFRTLTKSPHSWTWIRPISPRPYSRSLSFSVTAVRLPQAWRYKHLTASTSTIPKPAEPPSRTPSSQAVCFGTMSGYFPSSPGVCGLEGRLGLELMIGTSGRRSWPGLGRWFGKGLGFG